MVVKPGLFRVGLGIVALGPLFQNGPAVGACPFKVIVDHRIDQAGGEMLDRLGDARHGDHRITGIVHLVCAPSDREVDQLLGGGGVCQYPRS